MICLFCTADFERTDLSAVNWKASLSDFKLAFKVAAELKIPPAVQFLRNDDPDEGLESSAESELFDEG